MKLLFRNRGYGAGAGGAGRCWCAVLVPVLLVVCTTFENSVTVAARKEDRLCDARQDDTCGTVVSNTTDDGQPIPTAFVSGGGGFKTMTASMGIIRSWYEMEFLLANTTHFACNSGGCWFQIPFLYSQDYYDSAVGNSSSGDGNDLTVSDFLTSWGKKYHTAMTEAIATDQYESIEQYTFETASIACPLDSVYAGNVTAADIITAGLRTLVDDAYFPANNWYYYVDAMLSSYLSNATTQLFSNPRAELNKFVFVAAATLAPDTYQYDPSLKTTKLIGIPKGVTLLPISYTANEGSNGSWQFPAAINQTLAVSVRNEDPVVLNTALPPLSLSEVGAAASSAGGPGGSPTLAKQVISYALALPRFGFSKLQQAALKPVINTCLPLGMQNLSSPTEGNVVSTLSAWSPLFRYIDGGLTDNSAITHAVANMQKSCDEDDDSNPKYNCTTQTVRLMSINDAANPLTGGTDDEIKRLFANCDCGTTEYEWIGTGINPNIFAEDFPIDPNDPGWSLYSNTTYKFRPDNSNTTSKLEPSTSYAWRGTVTTVDNIPYGVKGGWQVELVILFIAFPPVIIAPGYGANYAFANIYSDIAQEQYESTLKLFKKLNLSQDWGAGGSQPEPSTSGTTVGGINANSASHEQDEL